MFALEIYILECGQGDTILLCLPGPKWILIDCNLPRGVLRTRFFEFLNQKQVNKLDLVCLTHPHEDHYTGLSEVVEHFTSNGRSIGMFCDSGVEPKQIVTLMKRKRAPGSTVKEFERLYKILYELIDSKRVRYFMANEGSGAIIEIGDEIQMIPLGPRADVLSQAIREVVPGGKIRKDLNRVSVVLGLSVTTASKRFDALLAADCDAEGCNTALRKYSRIINGEEGKKCRFDVVKVSHHGSADSHEGSDICNHRNESAFAVISAGEFDVLPDREVMREFLNAGWVVLLTTKRKPQRLQLAIELANRGPSRFETERHNIQITWREDQGATWQPKDSRVTEAELSNYQTARK